MTGLIKQERNAEEGAKKDDKPDKVGQDDVDENEDEVEVESTEADAEGLSLGSLALPLLGATLFATSGFLLIKALRK